MVTLDKLVYKQAMGEGNVSKFTFFESLSGSDSEFPEDSESLKNSEASGFWLLNPLACEFLSF